MNHVNVPRRLHHNGPKNPRKWKNPKKPIWYLNMSGSIFSLVTLLPFLDNVGIFCSYQGCSGVIREDQSTWVNYILNFKGY